MSSSTQSPGFRAAIALAVTAVAAVVLFLFLGDAAYDWIKAIHVIAVIAWMAGMLYLPRLFVYHCEATPGSELSETLKVMEGRLLRIIMNPAMILAWVLGLWMAWQADWFTSYWFLVKFAAVFVLSGVHGHYSKAVRLFAADQNTKSARYWRVMNEAPAVLMIIIVIMVVVKPF